MKKFFIILSLVAIFLLAVTGCGQRTICPPAEPTDIEEVNEVVIEATDSRVVTDKDEIEQMVVDYGIPMEAESIGSIVTAEIDASIFD